MFTFQLVRSTDSLMLDNRNNWLVNSETKTMLWVNNIILGIDNILVHATPLATILYAVFDCLDRCYEARSRVAQGVIVERTYLVLESFKCKQALGYCGHASFQHVFIEKNLD